MRTLTKFKPGQAVLLVDRHSGLWTGHMRKRRGRWWFVADVGRFSVRWTKIKETGNHIVAP